MLGDLFRVLEVSDILLPPIHGGEQSSAANACDRCG
eukprot:COSAG06_NODE_30544_length_537_cov_0.762557_2_plen_35_part_01